MLPEFAIAEEVKERFEKKLRDHFQGETMVDDEVGVTTYLWIQKTGMWLKILDELGLLESCFFGTCNCCVWTFWIYVMLILSQFQM